MLEATKSKPKTAQGGAVVEKINAFVWRPVKSGLAGFAIFFTTLLVAKYLAYLLGAQTIFEVDINDVYLCLIGFGLYFLIRILENFKDKK